MLNPVCYMRSFPMLRVLVSTPKLNLDNMPMTLLVVRVVNLRIRLRNKLFSCQSTNLLQDKPRLRLNPPKRRVCFRCNCWTRRVTSNLEGIKRRVRTIRRVGIGVKMLILMTRMPIMLGGTSKLNVRLNFLASCVRKITSLTCALGLKTLRDS